MKKVVENDPERAYLEVRALAAGFFAALVKNGYLEEARDFGDWFADNFDEDDIEDPWARE